VNESSGSRVVFDYKTSDRATPPGKAHRKKKPDKSYELLKAR
jgi:hypothetical protein